MGFPAQAGELSHILVFGLLLGAQKLLDLKLEGLSLPFQLVAQISAFQEQQAQIPGIGIRMLQGLSELETHLSERAFPFSHGLTMLVAKVPYGAHLFRRELQIGLKLALETPRSRPPDSVGMPLGQNRGAE
jgi:hypothetical protein